MRDFIAAMLLAIAFLESTPTVHSSSIPLIPRTTSSYCTAGNFVAQYGGVYQPVCSTSYISATNTPITSTTTQDYMNCAAQCDSTSDPNLNPCRFFSFSYDAASGAPNCFLYVGPNYAGGTPPPSTVDVNVDSAIWVGDDNPS